MLMRRNQGFTARRISIIIVAMIAGAVAAHYSHSHTSRSSSTTQPQQQPQSQIVETGQYTLMADPPAAGHNPQSALYQLVNGAKQSVDMTMYELSDQTMVSDLIAAHKRGVDVRVLLDSAYHGKSANARDYGELQAADVSVRWAWPGVIVHQKTIVADNTAAIGTGNLTSRYYSSSRDFWIIDTNPADVRDIKATFDQDFSSSTSAPSPGVTTSGSHLLWSPGSQSALVSLIGAAEPGTTLLTESEEMNSYAIEDALVSAAKRGVNVEVVMTRSSSWAAAFSKLEAAGVHVRTYPSSAQLYIHAKVVTAQTAAGPEVYVGSINYSTSSMKYNRELGVELQSPSLYSSLVGVVSGDYANAPSVG